MFSVSSRNQWEFGHTVEGPAESCSSSENKQEIDEGSAEGHSETRMQGRGPVYRLIYSYQSQ